MDGLSALFTHYARKCSAGWRGDSIWISCSGSRGGMFPRGRGGHGLKIRARIRAGFQRNIRVRLWDSVGYDRLVSRKRKTAGNDKQGCRTVAKSSEIPARQFECSRGCTVEPSLSFEGCRLRLLVDDFCFPGNSNA